MVLIDVLGVLFFLLVVGCLYWFVFLCFLAFFFVVMFVWGGLRFWCVLLIFVVCLCYLFVSGCVGSFFV